MGRSARGWTAKLSQLHEGDVPFRRVGNAYTSWHICTRVGNVTYLSPRIYLSYRCETWENFYPPIHLPRSSSFGVDRRGVARLSSVRFELGAAEWWRWSISLLVFHRFQSIKLVALVLPLADHAGAVPFFCIAATSVVFRISLPAFPFLYSRFGWSTVGGCNPSACSGENNARKAFVASGKGKDSVRNFAGAFATRKNWTAGTIELILYTSFSVMCVATATFIHIIKITWLKWHLKETL